MTTCDKNIYQVRCEWDSPAWNERTSFGIAVFEDADEAVSDATARDVVGTSVVYVERVCLDHRRACPRTRTEVIWTQGALT